MNVDLSKPTKAISQKSSIASTNRSSILSKRSLTYSDSNESLKFALSENAPKKLTSEELLLQELEKKRNLKAKLKEKRFKYY
jgi:hypothetical protein